MDIEDRIKELLEELNLKLDEVGKEYAKQLIKSKIQSKFKCSKDTDISWCKKYSNKVGIYYFEIKFNSIDEDKLKEDMYGYLNEEWNLSDRGSKPRIIKDRVNKYDIKNGIWIPFYIGKRKDLGSRLGQHINFKAENKSTSALRLNEIRKGVFKDAYYRVRFIELEKYSGDRYWAIERIENIIRNEINPICGKQ